MSRSALLSWPHLLGLLILAALWLGPLPAASREAFSTHMLLHLGVVVVAAPLIAIGLRRGKGRLVGFQPGILWAIFASLFEMAIVWGWHAPALHRAAMHSAPIFIVQQASFLVAGLVVWMVGFTDRSRSAVGAGALAMLLSFMHMSMLGVLLTLAPRLLYGHAMGGGAFGLNPLEDQQLGGALMALGGGLPYLIGAALLTHRLLSKPKQAYLGHAEG